MKYVLRKIHIGEDIWKWYLRGQRGSMIVFSPKGKRSVVPLETIVKFKGGDPDYEIDNIAYTILPSEVKRFIEHNLVE